MSEALIDEGGSLLSALSEVLDGLIALDKTRLDTGQLLAVTVGLERAARRIPVLQHQWPDPEN